MFLKSRFQCSTVFVTRLVFLRFNLNLSGELANYFMSHPLRRKEKLISDCFKKIFMYLQSVIIFLLSLLPRLNNPSSLNLSQRFMFSKPLIILLQLS